MTEPPQGSGEKEKQGTFSCSFPGCEGELILYEGGKKITVSFKKTPRNTGRTRLTVTGTKSRIVVKPS